jgi:predicted metal-dependent HD superfamily phosphohydrolase
LCEKEIFMLDEKRWNKLIERLSGNNAPTGSFHQVLSAYSETHRFYHAISHIEHCLSEFDDAAHLCESPDEVEFALWLHDVVYDPHASDNEERSAELATKILSDSRCPEIKAKKVRELILITRHTKTPATTDAQLVVDIDLSILGQPPGIFGAYEKNIRAEYSWVSEDAYRSGRSKILQGFLNRTSIYATERFEKRYGNQARENLIKALAALA